jgi:hypothetical protein
MEEEGHDQKVREIEGETSVKAHHVVDDENFSVWDYSLTFRGLRSWLWLR